MKTLAILGIGAISLVMAGICFEFGPWYLQRTHGAHVELSEGHDCDLSVSAFYLTNGVVSYSENGVCIGRTILSNDFLYDPLAIFPCPDHHSVVCLSWPDTFDAAFTIDFSKYHPDGASIPGRLKGVVVDSSDFEVRACTTKEVAFVKQFIQTADLKTFAACTRWGPIAETEDHRQYMLDFLDWSTSPMKDASPLILPEDPDYAESSP
jgi:hypothetical protein